MGMQQCIMIQSVSSHVIMAISGLVLKKEDVNTIQLGVDKISPAKVAHEVTVRQKIFRFVSNLGFNLMLTNLRKRCSQACATVAYKCAPDL